MTDHDPMCPILGVGYEASTFCYCERLRERDERVRADERQLVGRVWAKREDLLLADVIAGKETVNGARAALGYPPVHEVICEDDLWRELLEAKLDRISLMWRAACKERDAARAEVRALRKVVEADVRLGIARASRREVLADLRAKVEELHRQAVADFDIERDYQFRGREDAYGTVLTLIEEAGQ